MPKATSSVTAATAVAPAYEEAMAELEALVERMESGGLPLDQLLELNSAIADINTLKTDIDEIKKLLIQLTLK